jgi:oleate hydratase
MEKTKKARIRDKRDPEQTEAWILGTGTASLASASYLIKHAKVPPQKVHILESRDSWQEIWHHKGDPSSGYDQFGRCLPVPIGEPLKEILSCIPSAFPTTGRRAQSFLHAIQSAEVNRTFSTQAGSTCIVVQRDRKLQNIVTGSLDLNLKQRLNLVRLMLKGEKRLGRNHISDFFPQSFFETSFWAIWSAQ